MSFLFLKATSHPAPEKLAQWLSTQWTESEMVVPIAALGFCTKESVSRSVRSIPYPLGSVTRIPSTQICSSYDSFDVSSIRVHFWADCLVEPFRHLWQKSRELSVDTKTEWSWLIYFNNQQHESERAGRIPCWRITRGCCMMPCSGSPAERSTALAMAVALM